MSKKTEARPNDVLVLATAEELRAVFARAFAAIEAVLSDESDYSREQARRDHERITASIEALRFACVAAGHLGDASLVPLVVEAVETCERFEPRAAPHPTTFGAGLSLLLRRGAPVDEGVERLAEHVDARIRLAVADGLRPRGEPEMELLTALAKDPVAEVRKAAQATLATVREVAWWTGKFASDPVARLSAEEAASLKPALERLSELLDLPFYKRDDAEEEIVALASRLPDPLATELAEGVLATSDRHGARFTAMGTLLLGRPGGPEAFERLTEIWSVPGGAYVRGEEVAGMFAPLPAPERKAVVLRLADLAAARSMEERTELIHSAAAMLASTVGHAYPPGEDLTPLLDRVLALPPVLGKYAHDAVTVSSPSPGIAT